MKFWNAAKILISWLILIATAIVSMGGVAILAQRLAGDPFPTIFGWGVATVATGSMEPTIPVGSTLFIREQDAYTEGDIIMYLHDSGQLITHRLIKYSGVEIIVKGDANDVADPPITHEQILGKVQAVTDGFAIYYRKNPTVSCFGAGIVLILLVGVVDRAFLTVRDYLRESRKHKNTELEIP